MKINILSNLKPITIVNYWQAPNGGERNKVKRQAVLSGHLSKDETHRQMLLTKHAPARTIESFTHATN